MPTMKAAVVRKPGGPETLAIEHLPIPTPQFGEVLIRVKAFGLNRSELTLRHGLLPDVRYPRVPGVEAVGLVESAPGNEFKRGSKVATALGGIGQNCDGSYAEYLCVPAEQVQALSSNLSWSVLGALPETMQAAWGSLFRSLDLQPGESLLIRGGTTSVGLAAAAIARKHGAFVMATARSPEQGALLRANGVDQMFIDPGCIADQVREVIPRGADKVLELVGAATLADSLKCAARRAIVCAAGGAVETSSCAPLSLMALIPSTVRLTTYSGSSCDFMMTPLGAIVEMLHAGTMHLHVAKTFQLDDIAEAHRAMEANEVDGKIVILI